MSLKIYILHVYFLLEFLQETTKYQQNGLTCSRYSDDKRL